MRAPEGRLARGAIFFPQGLFRMKEVQPKHQVAIARREAPDAYFAAIIALIATTDNRTYRRHALQLCSVWLGRISRQGSPIRGVLSQGLYIVRSITEVSEWWTRTIARPLRIEFAGALYYV